MVAAASAVVLAALLGGLMALRTANAPAVELAPTISVGLTPARTLPSNSGPGLNFGTLPPSHDNDAGGARQHDQTPDADIDAYQRAR